MNSQNFDDPVVGVFPDDYDPSDGEGVGWLTGGGLAPPEELAAQLDSNFNWMISKDVVSPEPNSISPPNLMNSDINVNMARASSYAMFVTGEDWGQGKFTFDFMTDIELPYHEIDIFIADDTSGEFVFVEELTNTEGEWDDSAVFVPEGRHYIVISYVFNPFEIDTFPVIDGYEGDLYIDNVEFTQFGALVTTGSPTLSN